MALYVRFGRGDGSTGAGLLDGTRINVIREPFWEEAVRTGEVLDTAAVRLLAPCEPRSIICVGLNYASHLAGRPIPDPPTLFFKPLSSIAGPGDAVRLPAGATHVEPEGEIVVVIGRRLKGPASREDALAAIFGYTCGDDISERTWQTADGQWWRAKGSDTFGVFGPAIATGLDPAAIELRTRVNGEEVQHATSAELIRDIPEIVRLVSDVMTLVPGDIIFTGTPGQPPPISRGDVVEVEVSGVGVLRNPIA